MRADAERNRAKIVTAARDVFAVPGAEPSMAEVARQAGVGMATLYRNFPSRAQLVGELYRDELDGLCELARTAEGTTPGAAFFVWLERFRAAGSTISPLSHLLTVDTSSEDPVLLSNRRRVVEAAAPLLLAAQRTGEVRGDVSLTQVLDAVVALERVGPDPGARTSTTSVSAVDIFVEALRPREAPAAVPPTRG